ncbi:MAG: DEAD/DEAH box helicase [Gammaproteobacteria bacterium]|nr:DEAD/DEAH box helicase [Gammaproteobacteria bacterium]
MSLMVSSVPGFSDLGLSDAVLSSIKSAGYETPSPIQAETIPLVLAGRDVLGQAQTGTGKTAAFALPILTRIKPNLTLPQVLVLTPTRELALQVSESFQRYAAQIPGFTILPIYGGQEYGSQIRQLKRGVQVVVGTPGRVMDHMRKGTLKLDGLSTLVLDEADEMLRMGFIDDVEWVLEHTPEQRQVALFSATMPKEIRRIAQTYLREPAQITIKQATATADTIRQRFLLTNPHNKFEALARLLESEKTGAAIIFVRTKTESANLTEKLLARGFSANALNGDLQQRQRERCIEQLKSGELDILVATDVAARGLDVDRITHVFNYDIPFDSESYVHRIGRTGRAGRAGEAILLLAPRERHLLRNIERATNHPIEEMSWPSTEILNKARIERFEKRIEKTLMGESWKEYFPLLQNYVTKYGKDPLEAAAVLASLMNREKPFLLKEHADNIKSFDKSFDREKSKFKSKNGSFQSKSTKGPRPKMDVETFRIEVGRQHNVKPGNIVGAIANEAGINSEQIGHIKIEDDYSLVDLPVGMPKDVFNHLKNVWILNKKMNISKVSTVSKGRKGPPKSAKRKKVHH